MESNISWTSYYHFGDEEIILETFNIVDLLGKHLPKNPQKMGKN